MEEIKIEEKKAETKNEQQKISETKPRSLKSTIAIVVIVSVILSSFFGAVFGFMGGKISNKIFSKISQKFNIGQKGEDFSSKSVEKIVEEDSAVIDVVEKSSPAVVSIVITKDVPKYRSFFEDPFGFFDEVNGSSQGGTEKQKVGGGSGFIVNSNGTIVTNKHVVSDQNADYTVITNDGKEYSAKVLARDPIKDIAVIKIEGEKFPTLELGDSDSLKVGQTVIAIGNSLGEFSNSVSKGIISGLQRNVTAGSGFGQTEQLANIIQTDAAINPGNSGGPLLDITGKVVGVNVAMAQGAENVAFSIPSNQIKRIVEQIKDNGKISTPFLGVRTIAVNQEIQKENNLPFNYGALITRGEKITDLAVMPGSPADKAGLVENDIILEVNGKKVDSKNQLVGLISNSNVGDEITLKVWHKGNTKEIKVKLEEKK